MSELRFDGRVAIVTGGGRGLGRAYALLLGQRGAKVVVNDSGASLAGKGTDCRPAQAVAREIIDAGGEAIASIETVATPGGGRAIVDAALDAWGRLDILVHNAGNTRRAPVREMTVEDFEAVLDVHLRGAFHVGQPAFVQMCDAGYGRIVMTSSIVGLYGERMVLNYAAAKAGIVGLSTVYALDGAVHDVRCNVILPGAATRMGDGLDMSGLPPMDPELVAPTVAWLAHQSCSITGEMLISMSGRIARAYVAETPGVFRPDWTIEQVDADMARIRDASHTLAFDPVPQGFIDHLTYGFGLAARDRA
jgi:NAD(P)-dependent dehydrogenase (short-subunit alcohol dehydrogenase family)